MSDFRLKNLHILAHQGYILVHGQSESFVISQKIDFSSFTGASNARNDGVSVISRYGVHKFLI